MMMVVNRIARRVFAIELARDHDQHRADHHHGEDEDQFLRVRNAAEPERR